MFTPHETALQQNLRWPVEMRLISMPFQNVTNFWPLCVVLCWPKVCDIPFFVRPLKKWNRSHFVCGGWIWLKFGGMLCCNSEFYLSKYEVDPFSIFWDWAVEVNLGQKSLFYENEDFTETINFSQVLWRAFESRHSILAFLKILLNLVENWANASKINFELGVSERPMS